MTVNAVDTIPPNDLHYSGYLNVRQDNNTIALFSDDGVGRTDWKDSNLCDGDKITISIEGEVLTYVFQPGDINKLIVSGYVSIPLNKDDAIGVSYSTTANNFFNKAIVDKIVTVKFEDAAGNKSTGLTFNVSPSIL